MNLYILIFSFQYFFCYLWLLYFSYFLLHVSVFFSIFFGLFFFPPFLSLFMWICVLSSLYVICVDVWVVCRRFSFFSLYIYYIIRTRSSISIFFFHPQNLKFIVLIVVVVVIIFYFYVYLFGYCWDVFFFICFSFLKRIYFRTPTYYISICLFVWFFWGNFYAKT